MSNRRSALGRGIGALIPTPPLSAVVAEPAASEPGSTSIPVDSIDANPEQPRRRFAADELERLADSIRQHGVLQPIVVRKVGERYEILVGERRWRASRAAGQETIPAVVADVDGDDRLAIALVENIQRHDLNAIELAHAFRALGDQGLTQEEIGKRVSLERSTVSNHLRLLELPRSFQEDVEEGRMSAGHAKALLQVSNPERRRHLRDRVVREGLSVRALEQLGRSTVGGSTTKRGANRPVTVDPDIQRLTDQLRQRFQTSVKISSDARRGRIEIEYFGAEDLQRVSALLLGDV